MSGTSIWRQLEVVFNEGAHVDGDNSIQQLVSPGVSGLQVMIEGVVGSGKVTCEDLETFYANAGWNQQRSVNLEEFRSIISSLNLPELRDGEESEDAEGDGNGNSGVSRTMANQLADLYDTIAARQKSSIFRLFNLRSWVLTVN